MPASAQLGVIQQGLWQLAAPGGTPYVPPSMPTSARPWMAHLYNNDWSFRASLGAIIGQRPTLQQQLNSGFQPVTVELPTLNTTIQPGNLVVITEEGGDATGNAPAGIPVIGGIVEQVPDTLDVSGWKHEITITPFVAELGDAYLNKNYATATDVAQMVRDAVGQARHLRYTWQSIPNTGVTAVYNFSYESALNVLDHARLIAGQNYSWFVDAVGVVWFQAINTNASAMFTVTPKDLHSLQTNGGDISGLKNFALVVGGIASGATAPTQATYNNATSQNLYGLRSLSPPVSIPGVTDQTTLNNIATTIGGIYDRVIHRVTLDLPAYATRILLGQPGGATMRYFSPSKYSMTESEVGTGTYSPTYVVLDVQTDGIHQSVTLGDVPLASLGDVQYQVEANLTRLAKGPIIQNPVIQPASGGVVNNALGQALVDSTGIVSGAAISVLVNGGTQASGPITGKAAPPTGLSGSGGEVIVTTATFQLTRQATVWILAVCSNFVADAGAHVGAHPLYFQTDGVSEVGTAYGYAPVFTTGDAEARAHSTTILKISTLATGNHTVNLIWNSMEGTADTLNNSNNPIFVFQIGS